MRSREIAEEATPPGIDGLSPQRQPFYVVMPHCLNHAGLKQRLASCHVHYKKSSQYVVSILATSIQDYRTIELLFKASSSSGLGANASLAS